MSIRESIEKARQHLDKDPDLAVFMLRDFEEVENAGLGDLAWSLSGSGYCSKNDAIGFIEALEKWLSEKEKK